MHTGFHKTSHLGLPFKATLMSHLSHFPFRDVPPLLQNVPPLLKNVPPSLQMSHLSFKMSHFPFSDVPPVPLSFLVCPTCPTFLFGMSHLAFCEFSLFL